MKPHSITKHPLLLLHLACWAIYFMGDSAGHLASGYHNLVPSLSGALSGAFLTGLVALVVLAPKSRAIRFGGATLLFYLAAMIWDKILLVLHTEGKTTYAEAYNEVINSPLSQWLLPEYQTLLVFIAWALFLAACHYFIAHRDQQNRLNRALLQTRQAQLETLRYQLNPHFLFNVLNSVDVSVAEDDKQTARSMIQHLSRFLRSSLQQGEQDKITLAHEFRILDDFLSIEQLRFGDNLKLSMDYDPECEHDLLPPMLLQPLVENAVKFAWNQSEQGRVELTATRKEQQLVITIANSKARGTGNREGTGTGLRNTAERLRLTYGDDARLETRDQPGEYRIELYLPIETFAGVEGS